MKRIIKPTALIVGFLSAGLAAQLTVSAAGPDSPTKNSAIDPVAAITLIVAFIVVFISLFILVALLEQKKKRRYEQTEKEEKFDKEKIALENQTCTDKIRVKDPDFDAEKYLSLCERTFTELIRSCARSDFETMFSLSGKELYEQQRLQLKDFEAAHHGKSLDILLRKFWLDELCMEGHKLNNGREEISMSFKLKLSYAVRDKHEFYYEKDENSSLSFDYNDYNYRMTVSRPANFYSLDVSRKVCPFCGAIFASGISHCPNCKSHVFNENCGGWLIAGLHAFGGNIILGDTIF